MRLLVVCLGNICRSPTAEGLIRHRLEAASLADRVTVDSAGTGDWHVGQPPDRRSIACATGHGIDLSGLRARQIGPSDFHEFDWLLCADSANLRDVRKLAPLGASARHAGWRCCLSGRAWSSAKCRIPTPAMPGSSSAYGRCSNVRPTASCRGWRASWTTDAERARVAISATSGPCALVASRPGSVTRPGGPLPSRIIGPIPSPMPPYLIALPAPAARSRLHTVAYRDAIRAAGACA